jgi:predicted nucleotidyltransferase
MTSKASTIGRTPNASVLSEVVKRVVRAARPEKIMLFGSAARGDMGPYSDLDLLVIKRGRFNRRQLVSKIYDALYGAGAAVDIVIVTPEEVQRYRDAPWLVISSAVREGQVVYGA